MEWPEASQEVEGANKDELQRVIAGAGLISSSDYYQAEDYYNGKTTSSDGFWQDFQTALKTAKDWKERLKIRLNQKASFLSIKLFDKCGFVAKEMMTYVPPV